MWTYDFIGPADGVANIVMGGVNFPATPNEGGDRNAIWQALVLAETNNPPVIHDLDGDLVNYGPSGSGPVSLDVSTNATVSDIDNPANFDGGFLRVRTTANAQAGDIIDAPGAGANVIIGGTNIGTASGGIGGSDFVVMLNNNATPARVAGLLQSITFDDSGTATVPSRSFEWTFNDGLGGEGTVETDLTLTISGPSDTHIWEGDDIGDPTDWNIAANWSTNTVPDANDVAVFGPSATGLIVDLNGTQFIGTAQLDSGGFSIIDGTLEVGTVDQNGGANTISAQIRNPSMIIDVTGGTLTLENDANFLTAAANVSISGGAEVVATLGENGFALGDADLSVDNSTLTVVGLTALGGVLDDLELWLDASDINADGMPDTLSNGDTITNWQDKSGNNHDANVVQDDPSYVASGPGGRPVVSFDGNDQISLSDDLRNFITNSDGSYSIITVGRYTGGANNRLISVDSGHNWLFGFWGNSSQRWYADGWIHQGGPADTNWHVHSGLMNGAPIDPQADFYDNGALLVANSTGSHNNFANYAPDRLALGGWNVSSEFSQGEVAEVIVYDRLLTNSERLAVEHYLNEKYAINGGSGGVMSFATDTDLNNQLNVSGNSTVRINGLTSLSFADVDTLAGTSLTIESDVNSEFTLHGNGTGTGTETITSLVDLRLEGDITVSVDELIVDQFLSSSGDNIINGDLVMTQDTTIFSDSGTLTINGNIDMSAHSLTVDGPGNVVINGDLTIAPPNTIPNLGNLDTFATGDYTIAADGEVFDVRVDHDGTNGWLLVGRGREGWQWNAAGEGPGPDAVNDNLGTPAAFSPYSFSSSLINELIDDVDLDLTDTEIRIKRAADPTGSTYQESRWQPLSETDWRWNFDTDMAVDYQIVSGPFAPYSQSNTNTRDNNVFNQFDRIFTWAWGGHNNQRGFSYGSSVSNGANNATSFLWEFSTENHAIPYTEIYIRSEIAASVTNDLIKNGTGTLTLLGDNAYEGDTFINAGTVIVDGTNTGLGTADTGTVVANGATLKFDGNVTISSEAITLEGSGAPGELGSLVNVDENNEFAGPLTVIGNQLAIGSEDGTLTLSTTVDLNIADLVVDGPGDVVISGNIIGSITGLAPNLGNLSEFSTGDYAFDVGGGSATTIDARIDNDGTHGWLLVGRGRESWQWNAAGEGPGPDFVNDDLGTPAAFAPSYFSTALINDIIDDVGLDLTDVEIRIKRAADPTGSTYQESRWQPLSETDWRWNFDTDMAVDYRIVSGPFAPFSQSNTNTRDNSTANQFERIFTWAWGGHNNQRGFSYGSGVSNGANNATSFLWEFSNENHAIPYTEIYIRSLEPVGSNSVTKNGSGTLTLSGNNTYFGETVVNAGTLIADTSATALGGTASGTTVADGATLGLSGGIAVGSEALTIVGSGAAGRSGALVSLQNSNSFAGNLQFSADTVIASDIGGQTLTISGDIELQYFGLTVTGDGDTILNGTIASSAVNINDPTQRQIILGLDGLPGYNPLGFWEFNEGSGTMPQDSSSNDNDGTIVGSLNYVPGRTGDAGDFSLNFSPGNRVDIVNGATAFDSVSGNDAVTVAFWAFGDPAAQPRNNTTFNLGNNAGNRVAYNHVTWGDRIIYWDSGLNCCGAGTRLNTSPLSPDSLFEGQWNHYTFVKNGATNFSGIYINGALEVSQTNSTDPFGNPDFLRIAENYDGMLDDVLILDQALTSTQVQELYDARDGIGIFLRDNTLEKTGTGTLTLTGDNSYDGGTTVSAGTLLVNNTTGSGTGFGPVQVNNSATLGGEGNVDGAVTVSGSASVSPGTSPAALATGSVSLATGTSFTVELDGPTPGSGYDQLIVTGTVDLNSDSGAGATLIAGRAPGFVPALGFEAIIIDNDGGDAVDGTFAGLPEGATVNLSGIDFTISYQGGDGNDVSLSFVRPTTVFVDDSWSGTSPGLVPANSEPPGLVFGYNAFDVIQDGIDQLDAGGTLVVYGGSYTNPVNVDKALTPVQLATNSQIPGETVVNVSALVSLDVDTQFSMISAGLTLGSTLNPTTTDVDVTIQSGNAGLTATLNGNIGQSQAFASVTIDTAGPTNINGLLMGTDQLIKNQGSTLSFGAGNHSFQGTVDHNDGTINVAGSWNAGGGNVTLGNGVTLNGPGTIVNRAVLIPGGSNGVTVSGFSGLSNNSGTVIDVIGNGADINNNSISGSVVGIHIDTGSALVTANTLTNNTTGIHVENDGQVNFGAGNTITGGDVGLLVTGPTTAGRGIGGLDLNNTAFELQSVFFIQLDAGAHGGPEFIVASDASFDGIQGQNMTPSEIVTTDLKLFHFSDLDSLGLILLKTNVAYKDGDTLLVIGTPNRERGIYVNSFRPNRTTVTGIANVAGTFDMTAPGSRISIFALDGNDIIRLIGYVPGEVFGGAGNDYIYGGYGPDILHGQQGNDIIRGGTGSDMLIGGTGRDYLYGGAGNDVMIGGSLNSFRSYSDLFADLMAWDDDAVNMNSPSSSLDTLFFGFVSDDGEADVLSDSSGTDAFLHATATDRVFGASGLDDDSSWTH